MHEFDSVIQHCRLMNLGYQRPKFTWCNKRDDAFICKKLDRFLVNEIWLNQRTQVYGIFEAESCSDHLRGRFHMQADAVGKHKPFKFIIKIMKDYWKDTQPLF